MYITLEQTKRHLNLETSFTDDDNYLYDLIEVAEKVVENHISFNLSDLVASNGDVLPLPLQHAVLLFIGNLYANREMIAFVKTEKLPFNYQYLLDQYQNYN